MSIIWKPLESVKVSVNAANQSVVFIHFSGDVVLRGDDIINAVWQALPANFEQILKCFKEEFEGTDLELEQSVRESIALLQQHHLITEESC